MEPTERSNAERNAAHDPAFNPPDGTEPAARDSADRLAPEGLEGLDFTDAGYGDENGRGGHAADVGIPLHLEGTAAAEDVIGGVRQEDVSWSEAPVHPTDAGTGAITLDPPGNGGDAGWTEVETLMSPDAGEAREPGSDLPPDETISPVAQFAPEAHVIPPLAPARSVSEPDPPVRALGDLAGDDLARDSDADADRWTDDEGRTEWVAGGTGTESDLPADEPVTPVAHLAPEAHVLPFSSTDYETPAAADTTGPAEPAYATLPPEAARTTEPAPPPEAMAAVMAAEMAPDEEGPVRVVVDSVDDRSDAGAERAVALAPMEQIEDRGTVTAREPVPIVGEPYEVREAREVPETRETYEDEAPADAALAATAVRREEPPREELRRDEPEFIQRRETVEAREVAPPEPQPDVEPDVETTPPPPDDGRRDFLKKVAAVAIGGAIVTVPVAAGVAVFLDPLRRRDGAAGGGTGEAAFLAITPLDAVPDDGKPHQFPVVADRVDAWNKYRNVRIGAVYLIRNGPKVTALNVVCPHAGCFVDAAAGKLAEGEYAFSCPCHRSFFKGDGALVAGVSPRGMDELPVDPVALAQGVVKVRFQNFQAGTTERIPVT